MLNICGVSLEQGPGNLCSGGTRGNGWRAGEEELLVSWVPLVSPGLLGRGSGNNTAESSLAV